MLNRFFIIKTLTFLLNFQIFIKAQDLSLFGYTIYLVNTTNSQELNLLIPNNLSFALEFPSNPTTGYNWYISNIIAKNNSNLIEFLNLDQNFGGQYKATPVARGVVGSGGNTFFLMESAPNNTGKIEVDFVYKRSWEKTVGISKVVNINVGDSKRKT